MSQEFSNVIQTENIQELAGINPARIYKITSMPDTWKDMPEMPEHVLGQGVSLQVCKYANLSGISGVLHQMLHQNYFTVCCSKISKIFCGDLPLSKLLPFF